MCSSTVAAAAVAKVAPTFVSALPANIVRSPKGGFLYNIGTAHNLANDGVNAYSAVHQAEHSRRERRIFVTATWRPRRGYGPHEMFEVKGERSPAGSTSSTTDSRLSATARTHTTPSTRPRIRVASAVGLVGARGTTLGKTYAASPAGSALSTTGSRPWEMVRTLTMPSSRQTRTARQTLSIMGLRSWVTVPTPTALSIRLLIHAVNSRT